MCGLGLLWEEPLMFAISKAYSMSDMFSANSYTEGAWEQEFTETQGEVSTQIRYLTFHQVENAN